MPQLMRVEIPCKFDPVYIRGFPRLCLHYFTFKHKETRICHLNPMILVLRPFSLQKELGPFLTSPKEMVLGHLLTRHPGVDSI